VCVCLCECVHGMCECVCVFVRACTRACVLARSRARSCERGVQAQESVACVMTDDSMSIIGKCHVTSEQIVSHINESCHT